MSSETQKNNFMVTTPIEKLMAKFSVPCVISLVVGALYNIVDQIFIANASYLGSYGNAANTVVFPLTVVALAIAVMIGDGCCAFVSISLGAQQPERAHRSIGNAVVLSVLSSLLLTALYLVFQTPLLNLFGASINPETFSCAKEYFFYITLGIPFYVFGQAVNPIIRSDGSPKFAMVATLAGAGLNIVLDPIAIFVLRWGMMGAAVATVAGQVLTAILSIYYLCRMKTVRLSRDSFLLRRSILGKFLPLGICSFLAQISLVAAMAANNQMIQKYSALDPVFSLPANSQIPMAVIGIVMKFFQIVISVVIGIAAGCIPIVGYNIGAQRKDRARHIFTRLLLAEAVVGAVATLAIMGIPRQLIGIFGAAEEGAIYADFAVRAFRVYLCMIVLACINKAAFIFLQSLGKPWVSTFLSVLREVVLGVSLVLILLRFFGLNGILYFMPAADLLTFVASVIVIIKTYQELKGDKPLPTAN